nr:TolC family protein [Zoogloeaceae bacterium]
MNKRKRALVLCLAGLVSGPCWSEDLLGIYREALGSDAQFSAARSRAEAGREFAVQGRAGLLPNIGASGDTTFNNVDVEGQSSRNFNSNAWGVQLTQPLYRRQNVVESRQGTLRSQRAEIELALARQDLILRVSDAYFRVLNAQDALQAVTTLRTAS